MKALLGLTLIAMLIADQPRRVLLFYTDNGKETWKEQVSTLNGRQKDIRDRDIEVKSFSNSKENIPEWRKWKIDTTSAFTFLLIGRDGGEKLRSNEVVSPEKLFGLIDAMPMRRNEVKQKP
ncbi:DUF4174 domain-containing protein [Dyadobacter sp. CY347]|uniref:DUF4174 domain-containing protein n=1 Tax=Dyadobacter sp. CY347 TaxID=2909336 RepID=UPI001F3F3EA6|nr:DUF4174 domain-containing protein [Dyadobacter sp. CY347]MCF2489231.1 DUF4174 domain-containing protein [Dyadobacter sp. CY347]